MKRNIVTKEKKANPYLRTFENIRVGDFLFHSSQPVRIFKVINISKSMVHLTPGNANPVVIFSISALDFNTKEWEIKH